MPTFDHDPTVELNAPTQVSPLELEPMLRFFRYDHLREGLMRETSQWFSVLATRLVVILPRSPERTVALRKLLESKDAAVRTALDSLETLI